MSEKILPRILIVDDEKDNLETLKRLLRKDFLVETFTSGEAALEKFRADPHFDVLLSDQRMPGISGSEFFAKALNVNPLPTRILLTGYADLEAVTEAINLGHIWNYLAKPWEPTELLRILKLGAERAQMQASLESSRRELQKAVRELRARDWARRRSFQVLLHEFRTVPQILQGIRDLGSDEDTSVVREQFFESLLGRFRTLESEIVEVLDEEKSWAALSRQNFSLANWLPLLCGNISLPPPTISQDLELYSNVELLTEDISQIAELLRKNTAQAPLEINIENNLLVFSLSAPTAPYPEALAREDLDLEIAWPALIEPFVGAEDFTRHSQGLRFDLSRRIRRLAALGVRVEFQIQKEPHNFKVEALLTLPTEILA